MFVRQTSAGCDVRSEVLLFSRSLFANFASGGFCQTQDSILFSDQQMEKRSIYGLMWLGLSWLIWASSCRPAERKELKIPPLPAGRESVIASSLAALTDAIEDRPRNSVYYYRRAMLYEQSRQYNEALRDIKRAIEYRSTGEPYGRYYVLRGQVYLAQNKVDSAYADAVQSEKLGTQSAAAYLFRGQMYAIKRQYGRAAEALAEARQLTPHDPQIYYWQAQTAAGTGDTTQAIALLNEVLQKQNRYVPAYNRLTEMYTGLQDLATARQYAFAGLRIDSTDVTINNNLGRIYRRTNQTDSALIFFRRSLARDTSQHQLTYEIGSMYLEKKNYWAATPYFEKLSGHFTRYPDVPDILAVCYDLTGRERSKLEVWHAAIQADSTDMKTQRLYDALSRRVQSRRRQAVLDSITHHRRQLIKIAPVEIRR